MNKSLVQLQVARTTHDFRTPLRLWAGRLLAVLIQCDTLGIPIPIVIPARIV